PNSYTALGTDGFGRSDSRKNLREFFEVSREYIAFTALYELAKQNKIDYKLVEKAIIKYDINTKAIPSWKA
ncbi:MAG: hypothetical protein N4Q30_06665, partial [Neisseriaceae bacterium]|nr:hypothetical protein [Neisseriaceae bacterium]